MNTDDKNKLALSGRSDAAAVAIRTRAARLFAGLSQEDLASALGRRVSNISNIERGRSNPPWALLLYLYHEHRVDLNFMVAGAFAQLPGDVQDGLFSELSQIVASTDLLNDSDRPQLSTEAPTS